MIYMIARVFSSGKLAGFRLYDVENEQINSYSIEQVLNALKSGVKIENLKIEDNKIKGKGGSIGRYSAITTSGELISKYSVVVVDKNLETSMYTVVDYRGQRHVILEQALIKYTYFDNNIANGKVCKSSNGKLYVSPIEGEYFEATNIKKHKTKFIMPTLTKSTKITHKARAIIGSTEFKKIFSKRYPKLNFASVVTKRAIKDSTFAPKNVKAYNDYLETDTYSKIRAVGIIEINYTDYTQFLIDIQSEVFLTDDILFIGNKYKSEALNGSYSNIDSDKIIALGKIGLLVIEGNGITCTPYCDISTQSNLVKALRGLGITSLMLSKEDMSYILDKAVNCIYQLNFDIDIDSIAGNRKEGIFFSKENGTYDERQGVLELTYMLVSGISGYSIRSDIDKYLVEPLLTELGHMFSNRRPKVAYFSHCERPLVGTKRTGYISVINGETSLYNRETKLRYLGYTMLFLYNLMDRPNILWVNNEELEEIKNMIWYDSVVGDKLTVCIGEERIVYSINLLNKLRADDEELLIKTSERAKALNSKISLLGGHVNINPAGLIDNWEPGAKIVQASGIVGLLLESTTSEQAIEIYVRNNNFKAIVKDYRFDKSHIKLIFNTKSLGSLYGIYNYSKYSFTCVLDMNVSTMDEFEELMTIYVRHLSQRPAIVNGDVDNVSIIGIERKEFNMQALITQANNLFNEVHIYEPVLHTTNMDKVDRAYKVEFLKKCISYVPKRIKSPTSNAALLIKAIIRCLFNRQEEEELCSGFDKWLANR